VRHNDRRSRLVDTDVGSNKDWFVRLGPREWLPFTYERPADDALRLLGSIRRGARIGALAVTPTGEYLQVNGDHTSPLGGSQIRKALAKAEKSAQQTPARRPAPSASVPVVVVVKRRRLERK
jgi:hypothetical protein